jgi:hypothetical protein
LLPFKSLVKGELFMRRTAYFLLAALLLAITVGDTSSAALINWGSAQTISGDGDVSTTGSLLYAYNLGTSAVQATTVNGVTFAPFIFPDYSSSTSATTGSVTFTESPGLLFGTATLGTAAAPYANLSSNYRTLLDSAGGASTQLTITCTLGGLTIGQQYQLQWWTSNAADVYSPGGYPSVSTQASATNQITLDDNVTNSDGGLGQFASGFFMADSTTQTLTFEGVAGDPLINAFQVRSVREPSSVPEIDPNSLGSVLALVLGSLGLLDRRRLKAA